MSENNEDKKQPTVVTDARAPYEPPRLECEELFEVLALACGKIQPNFRQCNLLPRNS